jgi:hypothetical protein
VVKQAAVAAGFNGSSAAPGATKEFVVDALKKWGEGGHTD